MSKSLRPYQHTMKENTYWAWDQGYKNVLLVMDTGMGKTVTFCSIAMDFAVLSANHIPTCIMVHRKELVSQISLTLAGEEIQHNVIAPKKVINDIISLQRKEYNKQYYNYMAPITVVSVDTLNARIEKHQKWAESIGLWIIDEAHHVLKENKWGRACGYFPNAKGLGVTATPERLDKRGLGSHVDGVFDYMVLGPDSRWGIEQGFLSRYRIAVPPSDYQDYLKKGSNDADYTKQAMAEASKKSRITGDVVTEYMKHAMGKQAIVFASDIDTAYTMEENFISEGIKAKVLTGTTPDTERLNGVIDFRERRTQVLVNVDLFDEGFDVPGIECVIMARPTKSVGKFKQMCLDSETEILTRRGWMSHDKITKDDIAAGFNTDTKEIEWCDIEEIISRPRELNEKMFSYSSTNLNFRVTSNHDMIVKAASKTTKNWTKETIDEAAKRKRLFHVPVSAIQKTLLSPITDDELRFLGWFLSDGHMTNKGPGKSVVMISQVSNKTDNLNSIREVLTQCRFKFSEYTNKRSGEYIKYDPIIHFVIPRDTPKRKMPGWDGLRSCSHLIKWMDKSIPDVYESLDYRQLEVLLETLNLGDGTKRINATWNKQTLTITCGDNKIMADRLQSLLVRRGFRCNQYIEDRSHLNRKPCHMLHIKKVGTSSITGSNDKDGTIEVKSYKRSRIIKETDHQNETVWCIRNRLGTIVTRREGKVLIMGNCGRGLRILKGKEYLILIDHVGNIMTHGLPDQRRTWTLDRIKKRRTQANYIRICHNMQCNSPYDRALTECPWCGTEALKGMSGGGGGGARTLIEVDGDLELLDPEVLRQLFESTTLEDPASVAERVGRAAGPAAAVSAMRKQVERIEMQEQLSPVIALWAGEKKAIGYTDRQIHKLFYLEFGCSISEILAEPKARMMQVKEQLEEVLP